MPRRRRPEAGTHGAERQRTAADLVVGLRHHLAARQVNGGGDRGGEQRREQRGDVAAERDPVREQLLRDAETRLECSAPDVVFR